jgi:hypothetical protein
MDDFSTLSTPEIERERQQCLIDIRYAKRVGKDPLLVAERFNLLSRELNSRSQA